LVALASYEVVGIPLIQLVPIFVVASTNQHVSNCNPNSSWSQLVFSGLTLAASRAARSAASAVLSGPVTGMTIALVFFLLPRRCPLRWLRRISWASRADHVRPQDVVLALAGPR
jgi:hypothetical protein